MLQAVVLGLSVWLLGSCGLGQEPFKKLRRSIYKIHTVSKEPNFLSPWQDQSASNSSGTGFYIGKGGILTNAHVIAQGKYLAVQRDGDDDKVPAYVRFVAHDADLALLMVADESYFDGVRPLELSGLPKLRSPVAAIGYPLGGEQLSITEGVVSRTGYQRYSHSGDRDHLLVQVDSAINPGNSGGPVVQAGKVVGVAFQGHTQAENTGYVIPTAVVGRFLKDIEDGSYDGHPVLAVGTWGAQLSNPGTRRFFGLEEAQGVQIGFVADYSPLHGILEKNDIILAMDGYQVGVDGKVEYFGERVSFKAIYDLHQIGDKVSFDLMRAGTKKQVDTKIKPPGAYYDGSNFYGMRPKFLTFAGLVFTTLTRNYLYVWGDKWFMNSPFLARFVHFFNPYLPEIKQQEDLIVLSQILPDPVNTYVNEYRHQVLEKVDGKKVVSLSALDQVLAQVSGRYLRFDFFENDTPLILPLETARQVHTAIEKHYRLSPEKWLKGRKVDGAVSTL